MIYIETGSTDVYHNFAVEYYLTAVRPREEMTFLFWRTTPVSYTHLDVYKRQNLTRLMKVKDLIVEQALEKKKARAASV